MALDFEVDSLDGLEENVQGLYVEKDGKYRLDVSGIDPADELKEALRKQRDETKSEKERRKALEEAQQKLEESQAKEKGEFKTLWEKEQEQKAKLLEELNTFKGTVAEKEKKLAISSVIGGMTSVEEKVEALNGIVSKYVEINEQGNAVYSQGGIEMSKTELVESLKTKYPFLVDGSKADGGAGRGNKEAGSGSKTMPREEFDALNQVQRSKFIADGGKPI